MIDPSDSIIPDSTAVDLGKHSWWPVIGDALTCCIAMGALLVHCLFRSSRKIFWNDEVLTEIALRGASLAQTLDSLKDTINAMPPSYFVGVWLWSQAFGTSEFALRSFSCLAMGCAWILCWLLLRQFCTRLIATAATAATMFCSEDILFYNVEARCYALYMAAFFAASLLFVLCWNRQRAGTAILLATVVAHALLVTTHYVGCIYSASLFVAAALGGVLSHRRAVKEYAIAAAVGAAAFALCIPFYLAQRSLGGADNWVVSPGFSVLIKVLGFGLQIRMPVLVLMVAACASPYIVVRRYRPFSGPKDMPATGNQETPIESTETLIGVLVLCVTVVLVPVAIWCESLVGIRLFVERYMLPSFIVWPCILGLTLQQLGVAAGQWRHRAPGRLGSWAGVSPILCCSLLTLFALMDLAWMARSTDAKLAATKAVGVAIVETGVDFLSDDLHDALQSWHYGGGRAKYLKIDGGDQPKTHVKIAESLDRRIPQGFVVSSDELRSRRGTFLVRPTGWNQWKEQGIPSDAWHVLKNVGQMLVIVER